MFAWANLLCMGKSILYGHNYFAWAVFTGNYCVRNEGLVPKPRTKLAIFMRKISLRLITACIRIIIRTRTQMYYVRVYVINRIAR